jgi:hypothetical protein
MTASSKGKLPLEAQVYLNDSTLDDAQVCVHRKSFAMATVTHLDIEHPSLLFCIFPLGGSTHSRGKNGYLDYQY